MRKARRRLAQRSYRSRKQAGISSAPDGSSAPPEVLADSLRGNQSSTFIEKKPTVAVLESFSDAAALLRFPTFSPSGQVVELSKSQENVQKEDVDVTSLVYRIVRACFVRGIAAMSWDTPPEGWTPHPLCLPLRIGGAEFLVGLSVSQMQDLSDGYSGDARFDEKTLDAMPSMFRIVEGNRNNAIAREAPPNLQRLQYGRTRTILRTTLPNLQDEFLEARDVEEYLEERGIKVRGTQNMVELELPSAGGYRDDGHDIGNWTIFGQESPMGPVVPSGLWSFTPSPDQFHILFEGRDQLENASSRQGGTTKANSKITLSLDKLVHYLVANAQCLGPAPGITKPNVDFAIRSSIITRAC